MAGKKKSAKKAEITKPARKKLGEVALGAGSRERDARHAPPWTHGNAPSVGLSGTRCVNWGMV